MVSRVQARVVQQGLPERRVTARSARPSTLALLGRPLSSAEAHRFLLVGGGHQYVMTLITRIGITQKFTRGDSPKLGGNKRCIGHPHRLPGTLLPTQRFQFSRTGTSTPNPEESLRLAPLDQVGRYGVAVPIVATYSVGCVGGMYERHNRHYSHHRDEQKADQDQGQEPRYRPANC